MTTRTHAECALIEVAPETWYYILEDRSAPEDASDWRQHAKAYGPFATNLAAGQHLHANHRSPGGYTLTNHAMFRMDDVFRSLIEAAPANMRLLGNGNGDELRLRAG